MSMFRGSTSLIAGLLVVGVVTAWWIARRHEVRDDAREELIAELQQWPRWPEFSTPLLAVIDENHEVIFKANYTERHGRRRRSVHFDEDGYRAQMYLKLREALSEMNEDEALIELEQFRSRQKR